MQEKILFFGLGAVGSVFALFSKKAGYDVFAVGRKPHVEAIQKNQLRLSGIFGEAQETIHAATSLAELEAEKFSLLFLTVKTYDTASSAAALAPYVEKAEAVVSLQNGLGNDAELKRCCPAEKVFLGRVIFGAELTEPGSVKATVIADATRIGQSQGRASQPLLQWIQRVDRAGLPTAWTEEILPLIYDKALYNAALNPLGTLLRKKYGELSDHPSSKAIMDSILAECLAALEKAEPSFPYTLESYRDHFYRDLLPPTRSHYPSMLRDLKERGKTEIASLNGAFVRLGEERGVALPVNRALVSLIQTLCRRTNRSK